MYRDVAQWTGIRRRILREGVSIQQVVRETGISRTTVRKMLNHSEPKPYGPRGRKYPKLGPHITSIQAMLREKTTLPPSARNCSGGCETAMARGTRVDFWVARRVRI